MFHGPSWVDHSRVPLCSSHPDSPQGGHGDTRAASRLRKIDSSGASSRLAPLPLPEEPRHCLPAEIGPLVTRRTRQPLPALGEAGTAVPITKSPCTCPPSRKSEKLGKKPVDNGDIGNNRSSRVTVPAPPPRVAAIRLLFRSPPPTSSKCLNRLRSSLNPPISPASTRRSARRF